MKVNELISELMQMPANTEVAVWDELEGEYMPVQDVLWEEGCAQIHLLTINGVPRYNQQEVMQ